MDFNINVSNIKNFTNKKLMDNNFININDKYTEYLCSNNPLFINREIGLLNFYQRILLQSANNKIPLLERLKYLAISKSHLDELFEVRISKLLNSAIKKPNTIAQDGNTNYKLLHHVLHASSQLYKNINYYYRSLHAELNKNHIQIGIINSITKLIYLKDYNKLKYDQFFIWMLEYFFKEIYILIQEQVNLQGFIFEQDTHTLKQYDKISQSNHQKYTKIVNNTDNFMQRIKSTPSKQLAFAIIIHNNQYLNTKIEYMHFYLPRKIDYFIKIPNLTNHFITLEELIINCINYLIARSHDYSILNLPHLE